jgi:hypothetical protein
MRYKKKTQRNTPELSITRKWIKCKSKVMECKNTLTYIQCMSIMIGMMCIGDIFGYIVALNVKYVSCHMVALHV